MKERTLETQCLAEKESFTKKALVAAALAWALSLWSPSEWLAQNTSTVQDGASVTEVTKPWTEIEDERIIDLEEAIQWIEVNWWNEGKEPRIWVHGFIQVWTSVVPDFAGIFSDKVSMLMCVSAIDQHSWLWVSFIRLDDFHTNPEYPVSRASVIVPSRNKSFGKWSVWASVECTFVDQLPWNMEIMPVIVWSYSTDNGWAFEWKYFHGFQKWPDMNSFRLWISKKIGDALTLTAQWWYKSDYDKRFFGRIIVDVDLWNWLWAQVSCIAKNWGLTPTAWVLYKF